MKDRRKIFKVGDRAKVLYKPSPLFGKIGVVVKVGKSVVYVKVGDLTTCFGNPKSLEKQVWSVS